jgi:hypothetical protein
VNKHNCLVDTAKGFVGPASLKTAPDIASATGEVHSLGVSVHLSGKDGHIAVCSATMRFHSEVDSEVGHAVRVTSPEIVML